MTAIDRLPEDHYVKFGKEKPEEDGHDDDDEDVPYFLVACVFKKAPEDGWPSRGARFQHPQDWSSHQESCPKHSTHDDCVLFGISAHPEEPEVLERLLINAINERWGTK